MAPFAAVHGYAAWSYYLFLSLQRHLEKLLPRLAILRHLSPTSNHSPFSFRVMV